MNPHPSSTTSSPNERQQAARQARALWISVALELVGFMPYVLIAILSGSLLLLSDLADFFRNFAANAVSLHILGKIRKGQVHEFNYGAGKLERAGSLFGALCYVGTLTGVAAYSVVRFLRPAPLHVGFTLVGMLGLIVAIVMSAGFWIYYKRLAVESPGPLIDVQWRHQRTDVLSSAAVLVALGLAMVFREEGWAVYIDPACGLAYSVFAIGSYVPVMRESLKDLLDQTLAEDVQIIVMRRLAEHFNDYEAFHGVRSRRAGNRLLIEVTLGFDPAKTVGEAVKTIESLRTAIEGDIANAEVSVGIQSLQNRVQGG
ncbi:MAG: cation diffusion facilitator family transporter [Opitutae bacterium]|nr:cation diffusion facilitator family transporter [Opitutae bacterium]